MSTKRLMRCVVCQKGGSLHEMKLLSPAEQKRNYTAQALKDHDNKVPICQPCHRAYLVLLGRTVPDQTTAPIVILYRERLDDLITKRNELRESERASQLYRPFGQVKSESIFQNGLEGF